jgi:hypothetical protein
VIFWIKFQLLKVEEIKIYNTLKCTCDHIVHQNGQHAKNLRSVQSPKLALDIKEIGCDDMNWTDVAQDKIK